MSKVTSLHSIFRKNSIYGANIGFHTLTFARSLGRWRCLKPRATYPVVIEGHLISNVYMDEVLRSVALPFCAKTSHSTRPRMTMPEHTSLESAKTMLCVQKKSTVVEPQNAPLHNMLLLVAYCVPCIHNMLRWGILCTLHTQYATRGAYCVGSVHMLFQWSSEGTQYALLENMSRGMFAFFLTVLSTSICLSYEPCV